MSKFHINWKGEPGVCTAKPGNCPLGGGEEDHFASKDEARAAYEAAHNAFAAPVSKPVPSYATCEVCEDMDSCPLGDDCPVAEDAAALGLTGPGNAPAPAPSRFLDELSLDKATEEDLVNRKTELYKTPFSDMGDLDHLEIAAIVSEQERRVFAARKAQASTPVPAQKPKAPAKSKTVGWQSYSGVSAEDSKVIVKPKVQDPGGGYMGGSLFVGGKASDAYLSAKDAAKNVRGDIREAVKAGELPVDLDYSVRMNSSGSGLRIYIGRKALARGEAPGTFSPDEQQDSRLQSVRSYLDALGNQYARDNSNAMVDYFNSQNRALVYFRDKWT